MATARDYSSEIDKLSKDLSAVRSDIKTLTQAMSSDVRNGAGKFAETVSARAHTMAESAREVGKEGIATVSHQVEQRPLTSVLTAAGVGFVIGALLRR